MALRRSIPLFAAPIVIAFCISVGAAAGERGTAVIIPGNEALLGDMMGLGAELAGGCSFAGASADRTLVRSTYECPSGRVVLELRHPDAASDAVVRTDRFALVAVSGSAPSALTDDIEARIRAREAEFEWSRVQGADDANPYFDSIERAAWLALAGLLLAVVVGWSLVRRLRAATATGAAARPALLAIVATTLSAVVLAASLHAALRVTGDSFAAMLQGAAVSSILPKAGLVFALALVVTASLASVARFGTGLGARLWALAVVASYFAIGYPPSLLPDDLHYFAALSTYPPNTTMREGSPHLSPVEYRVTSRGFREPSFEDSKAEGVVRVALLGDSFVFGTGVDYEGTLQRHLASELARRWPGRRFEVLNLGIPGNNVSSHVDMYRAVSERLDPDVVALGLTLVNDLSRWDEQATRRDERRIGVYSFVRFLIGDSAESLWALLHLERRETAEGLAHFDREMARLAEMRSPGSPILLVFGFSPWSLAIEERLKQVPDALVVPSRTTVTEEFLPLDGHPTSFGNQKSATHIAETLSRSPDWQRLVGR